MEKITYKVEQVAPSRWFVSIDQLNWLGESIVIEFTKVEHNLKDKNDLMNLWKKNNRIKKTFETHWAVHTYIRDREGSCYGRYNPTITKMYKIDFDWLLEATEENAAKLFDEIIARAFSVQFLKG